MAEGQSYPKVRSELLSTALDGIGLSAEMAAFRIDLNKKLMLAMEFCKDFEKSVPLFAGSQYEGTTVALMDSDNDVMTPLRNFYVTEKRVSLESSFPFIFLMIEDGVRKGFVKLELLSAAPSESLREGLFTANDEGTYFFSSKKTVTASSNTYKASLKARVHGPSVAQDRTEHLGATDSVSCIYCGFWPRQAQEWLERERKFDWPTMFQLEKAEHDGCLVVPVGFSGSPTEDIEWRISFSLLERDLIWSWNNTQVKCYVFLKFLLKRHINCVVPEVLNTYQLKTLMFWMVEESSFSTWQPDQLATQIMESLQKLLSWVYAEHCPHYFIRENNMFEAKVHGHNRNQVIIVLEKLISTGLMYCLQQVEDVEDFYYRAWLNEIDLSLNSTVNVHCRTHLNRSLHESIFLPRAVIFLTLTADDLSSTIEKHCDFIKQHSVPLKMLPVGQRRVLQVMLSPFYSSLGSHLLGKAVQTQDQQAMEACTAQALYYLELGKNFDAMSGKLKLAMFHYVITNYVEALEIISEAEECLNGEFVEELSSVNVRRRKTFFNMSGSELDYSSCGHQFWQFLNDIGLSSSDMPLKQALRKYYAIEVICLPHEMPSVPKQIGFEICRAKVQLALDVTPQHQKHLHKFAAFDSIVFAHFLRFMCYHQMENDEQTRETLLRLMCDVQKRGDKLFHHVSALNLVSHCALLINDMGTALSALSASLQLEPSYMFNAAHWILATMLNSYFEQADTQQMEYQLLYTR